MKVSIILPTYNRASSYLKEAIDSVINQSYMNWELIVIDNNSTDNTIDLDHETAEKLLKILDFIDEIEDVINENFNVTTARIIIRKRILIYFSEIPSL